MTFVIRQFDRLFAFLDDMLSPILIPTLGRLVFAGVLLMYFWRAAWLKLGDGVLGFVFLDPAVYFQMFPKAVEAAGYDPSALPFIYKVIALFGTWAEFILPALIVIGLATRVAAFGMIIFVIVQSATDIVGHGVDAATIGKWFDNLPDAAIVDQRSLWLFLLFVLVMKGAGPLSADYIIARRTISEE